ncbi:MAG TPA: DEAD/DEAH box helicase [Ktedonobacteraceae bacterium]|nr:DEAD/DEAH box helicase [Ktedonobacteraceae bacterium]
MPSFNDFPLQPATHAVLANMEITEPTPIQAEAIPALLAGNDLVGQSATGSGKTLAYGIPLVERLAKDKRVVQALVLVPTRELAVQVNTVLSKLATSRRLSTALLVGGRAYGNQISALRYGSQIVVGTPGRVKDHLERGSLVLSQLRICVLDEADQMLDSGFAPIIEEILATTPDTRQMALFSATMPDWIEKLQKKFLRNPVKVDILPATGAQSTIEQIAYQVPQKQKMAALCSLLHSAEGESSLIFGRTKFGVERLGKQLSKLGFTVGTLHGNKSQHAREEVLTAFRRGQVQTLLATNVAARGLDITGIYQVINYELPESSELFTHRIGRTGRMGRQGKAITLLEPSDIPTWRRMARSLGQAVALQRLAIDEEPIVSIPLAKPEASVTQEYEQNDEQRPVRERKHFSLGQERDRFAGPKHESHTASGPKRREKESVTSVTPASLGQERDRLAEPKHESHTASGPKRQQKESTSATRVSPSQERSRFAGPKHESYTTSGSKRRQKKESVASATPTRIPALQPEGFTLPEERPYSDKARDGRRAVGKQASVGRTTGKHKAHPFAATEPQHGAARRKPKATSVARTRQVPASNRSFSR